MKASWNWLTDYVPVKAAVAEVAMRLTMAGLTVENVEETAEDFILEVEITSNRPDWLCHLGIARELAALYGFQAQVPALALRESGAAVQTAASLEVRDPHLCPLYTGRVITGVRVAPSPEWLRKKIEAIGLRCINNVVDATNFVLYECGQPLHAFDAAKVGGRKVVVRRALAGEGITLIDGGKHTLTGQDLVIADERRPIALAGIMGGADTEIDDRTTDVFLESAKFDQYSVRLTSKRLGISTDASYRFERGIDLETVDWASRRCAALIADLAGGRILKGSLACGKPGMAHRRVSLRLSRMADVLGAVVPAEDARAILASLGFAVATESRETITVDVPGFRADVKEEIDLIEEVARIYGYDRVPVETGLRIATGDKTARERVWEAVDSVLTAAGFYGCVSHSLVSGDLCRRYSPWTSQPPLYIENRAGQENAFARTSLVPSLLAVRKTNEDRKLERADLYEVAHVYLPSGDVLPHQPLMVAAVTAQEFGCLKGAVERMLVELGGDKAVFEPCEVEFLGPGKAARVMLNGKAIGYAGQVNEAIRLQVDLRQPVCAAEVDLSVFEALPPAVRVYVPLQRFPAMERDIAVVLADGVPWADILDCILTCGAQNLESTTFASVYRGKPIPEGRKCIACHLLFRAPDRTLTSQAADEATAAVVAALKKRFGAQLR